MDWFTVDKAGLAKLLEKRGKAFAIFELIQNAWDTDAKRIDVKITPLPNKPFAEVVVADDDPNGFSNLAHAFTLFAESEKKTDPTKRGRFNLGEKLVLALCSEAEIRTTKGVVYFEAEGRRSSNQHAARTERGSIFKGIMRMTRAEYDGVVTAIKTLLPPENTETRFNGDLLPQRPIVKGFEETLPTERSDEEGNLRPTRRKTGILLHEVRDGEKATLYEMGIPVVELEGGDKWHVNVQQKVPLNVDRDNVTPAYLRELRTYVLNHTFDMINGREEAAAEWVRDAAGDERAAPEALQKVYTERFTGKRVIADPSDPEGTKLAVSRGYTVIPAGALSKNEWNNVRAHAIALPAGKVTPSPKPFHEDGSPLKLIPDDHWTDGMTAFANFAERIGKEILGITIEVRIAIEPQWPFAATFGRRGTLVMNAGRLGKKWFDQDPTSQEVLELLVHEFGHFYGSDHLSKEFHDGLCTVGARLATLALTKPSLFRAG